MIIFKDKISGDEMFSDTFPMKDECDGEVIKVTAKMTSETTDIDERAIGGNKSAEGGGDDEGADASTVSGLNVILSNRLVATGFDKKGFKAYAKDYMKTIVESLKKDGADAERIAKFKTGATAFVKQVIDTFKEWEFYMGESMNAEGSMAYVNWDGETPYVYFLRAAIDEEKV